MPIKTKEERFFSSFIKTKDNDCWEWSGPKDIKGYGRFRFAYRTIIAHRYSYEYFVGEIPTGLVIDHLCRNPSCVNPNHLEAVSIYENCLRGINYLKSIGEYTGKDISLQIGQYCNNKIHYLATDNDIIHYPSGGNYCRGCRSITHRKKDKKRKQERKMMWIHKLLITLQKREKSLTIHS